MDIDAYLRRIGYSGSLAVTAETLRQLHRAHLLTVPFENLSMAWGEPIVLSEAALFEKIVRRGRGGFCYELNGLFAALLRALGFSVDMLEGGVASPAGEFGPPFDHMLLAVTLGEPWLADVGFGDCFADPLRLDERAEQLQGGRAYVLRDTAGGLVLLQRDRVGIDWKALYRFDAAPHTLDEYDGMCHFHQTSPASHFTTRRLCSVATDDGRVTLSDKRLVITKGDARDERELGGERERTDVLRDDFGISAPPDAAPR